MNATIAKWGNSLALRLPKAVVDSYGLQEGDSLRLTASENKIVLSKVRKIKKYSLEETLGSFHTAQEIQDIGWGDPVGREVW